MNEDVIYVLGGTQDSLKQKYALAAHLYLHERVRKIMVLARPGITEYDQGLQRNLTNDEWSIKELVHLGISRQDIELVLIPEGFFGTMSEARGISAIIAKRGIRKLLLVCAEYHSDRVAVSFSAFMRDNHMNIEIRPVYEKTSIYGRFIEKIKLILYKYVLVQFEIRPEGAGKIINRPDNANDSRFMPIHACISLIR